MLFRLHEIHFRLHETQCTDSKSIISLSRNKLLVNPPATVVSLATSRLGLPTATEPLPASLLILIRQQSGLELAGHPYRPLCGGLNSCGTGRSQDGVLFHCPDLLTNSQLGLKAQSLLGKLNLVTHASGTGKVPSSRLPI